MIKMALAAEAMPNFSTTTMENARKAKVSMEQFYENLLIQVRPHKKISKYFTDTSFILGS